MGEIVLQRTESEVLVRVEAKKLLSLRLFYYPSRKYDNHAEFVVELRGSHLIVTVLDHGWHISDVDVRRRLTGDAAERLRARMTRVASIEEFTALFDSLAEGGSP